MSSTATAFGSPFAAVKGSITLSEYVESATGITLSPTGMDSFRGPCPIHGSANLSTFSVDDDHRTWKCWSGDCGSGTVIDFYFATHPELDSDSGADMSTALGALAEYANVDLTPFDRHRSSAPSFSSRRLKEAFTSFAQSLCMVLTDPDALPIAITDDELLPVNEYLDQRNIPDSWIEQYTIGFAPSPAQSLALARYVTNNDDDLAVAAGILRRSEHSSTTYCPYANRLTIALKDKSGTYAVGLSARLIPHLAPGMGADAKYINTHDTAIYHKSDLLYNHHTLASGTGPVLVVEGSFDVMAAAHHLHETQTSVVASSGTSFTAEHVAAIKATKRTPIFAFDADDGGTKGFLAATKLCASTRIPNPVALPIPPTLDIFDALISDSDNDFAHTFASSVTDTTQLPSLLTHTVTTVAHSYASSSDDTGYARVARPVYSACTRIADRNEVIDITAQQFGITRPAAEQLVASNKNTNPSRARSSRNGSSSVTGGTLTDALLTTAHRHPAILLPYLYATTSEAHAALGAVTSEDPDPDLTHDLLCHIVTKGTNTMLAPEREHAISKLSASLMPHPESNDLLLASHLCSRITDTGALAHLDPHSASRVAELVSNSQHTEALALLCDGSLAQVYVRNATTQS